MSLRSRSIAFLASCVLGCGGAEPTPPPPATPAAAAPAASIAISPPSAAPEPGPAPELRRVAVDVGATMARLPANAAIYGWVRPAAADTLVSWTSRPDALRRDLEDVLPEGSVRALLEGVDLEPGAPIAFSVVGPERAPIEGLLKALIGGKTVAALAREIESAPPNGAHVRLVAVARANGEVAKKLRARLRALRLDVAACPGEPACAEVGGAPDLVFTVAGKWLGRVDVDGTLVEIDLVYSGAPLTKQLQFLAEKRKAPTSGPAGRCTKLDPETDLSLCVDADRAGELGAATGMWVTFQAVALGKVEPKIMRALLEQGRTESLRNVELAKPKRPLLDDGTVSFRFAPDGYTLQGTWALTKNSAPTAEKKLAEPVCAGRGDLWTQLAPTVAQALGDRGPDFAKVEPRIEHLREAGFGGLLVLFGRTWPNFLGAIDSPKLGLTRIPLPEVKVCARTNGGRLELEVSGEKLPLGRL